MLTLPPSWPWYTWLGLTIVALLSAGLVGACITLLAQGCRALLLAVWVGGSTLLSRLTGWRLSSYGTAHWAGRWELAQAGVLGATGISLGTWGRQPLTEATGGHVALIGPPRSGKSRGLIMPALTAYAGSIVASDLRGELYAATQAARERLGPVYRFAPTQADSCRLNLLDTIRWGAPEQQGDLARIVTHLLPEQGDESDSLRRSARPLLTAIITDRRQAGEGHFPAVLAWMTSPGQRRRQKLEQLVASPDPVVSRGARRMLDLSDRMQSVVWETAMEPLDLFADPLVAAVSEQSDLALEDLRQGVRPVALYLVIPFADIRRLKGLLGCLMEQLVAVLGSAEGAARHPVLLCLDEAANLGHMPELETGMSHLQGSGVQVLLVWQNLRQVTDTYGPTSPLLASCRTTVAYTPNDVDTAQVLVDTLGESTVTGSTWSPQGTRTQEHGRPLLTVGEVLRVPATEALVFVQGCAPIAAQKLGQPHPQTVQAQAWQWCGRHPWVPLTATAGLLLALMLWPAWRTVQQVTSRVRPATTAATPPAPHAAPLTVQPTPAPAPGAWALVRTVTEPSGEVREFATGTYADQATCAATRSRGFTPAQQRTLRCAQIP